MLTIAGRVALAIVFILALGLVAVSEHQPMVASPASAQPRFQIVINPNVRADTYLLDTETGRTWKPESFTQLAGDPDLWVLQAREDNPEQFAAWLALQKNKEGVTK